MSDDFIMNNKIGGSKVSKSQVLGESKDSKFQEQNDRSQGDMNRNNSTQELDHKKTNEDMQRINTNFSHDNQLNNSDIEEFMASDGEFERNNDDNSDDSRDMSFNRKYANKSLLFKEELIKETNMKYIEEMMVRKLNERSLIDQRNDVHLRECYEIFKLHISDIGKVFKDTYFKQHFSSLVNRQDTNLFMENKSKEIDWLRLGKLYNKPKFLRCFDPRLLFDFKKEKYLGNLATVLAALCDHPDHIKNIFVDSQDNNPTPSGVYLLQIYVRGKCNQILVDDSIPLRNIDHVTELGVGTDDDMQDARLESVLCMKPPVTSENFYDTKVDIWPHLVAKAFAKNNINYERICNQSVLHFLRDLVSYPVRQLRMKEINWDFLRAAWVNNYVVIGHGNQKLLTKHCALDFSGFNQKEIYCVLNHAFEDKETKRRLVNLKCYSHPVKTNLEMKIDMMINIDDDWRSHRSFGKFKTKNFWLTWSDFEDMFSHLTVAYLDDNYKRIAKKFSLKKLNYYNMEFEIQENGGPVFIELQQLDKIFCKKDHQYCNIRVFLYKISDSSPKHVLEKGIFTYNKRDSIMEHSLPVGHYGLIVETDDFLKESKDFMLNIFYRSYPYQLMQVIAYEDDNVGGSSRRAFSDMLCNAAIDKGEKTFLTKDEKVCLYILKSVKLGLFIIAFANLSEHQYSVMQKYDSQGVHYIVNKEISEDEIISMTIAPFSKKSIVFKTRYLSDVTIKLVDTCIRQVS